MFKRKLNSSILFSKPLQAVAYLRTALRTSTIWLHFRHGIKAPAQAINAQAYEIQAFLPKLNKIANLRPHIWRNMCDEK